MQDRSKISFVSNQRESGIRVWMKAISHPDESTYAEMATTPGANASSGYLWFFIGAIVQFLLVSLVQRALVQDLSSQFPAQFPPDFGSLWLMILCAAPLAAVFSTFLFGIGVAVVQWIAGRFGGKGRIDQLTYVLSAILAPYLVFSGLLALPSTIPLVGWLTGLIAGLAGLYILVLATMAVKGVNRFGWGAAIGSLLVPLLVIAFICACLVAGAVVLLVPVFRQTTPPTF